MKLFFSRSLTLSAALFTAASTCSVLPIHAQENPQNAAPTQAAPTPTAPAINPVARQLMAQTYNAYKALNSYSSEVAWQEGGSTNGGKGRVAWQKPNRLRVQISSGDTQQINVLNGSKFIASRVRANRTRYISETSNNASQSIIRALQPIDISGISLAAGLVGRSPLQTMSSQIEHVSTRKAVAADAQGLDEKFEVLDIVEVALKTRETPMGPLQVTVTFTSARADHLLRRVRIQMGSDANARSLSETYRKVQVNAPIDAKNFTYLPPLQAKRVSEFADGYDERLEKGTAPFAFQTTALDGKKLSLNDYKNRVVLLDFWATWCLPCREEMPNIIATYKKYHRRGFDIVGISLDRSQGALEEYTKQNKMTWRQIFDSQDLKNSVAAKYGVQAIPFALLIGRDGKIAAINPRGPQLETAVKAALKR